MVRIEERKRANFSMQTSGGGVGGGVLKNYIFYVYLPGGANISFFTLCPVWIADRNIRIL